MSDRRLPANPKHPARDFVDDAKRAAENALQRMENPAPTPDNYASLVLMLIDVIEANTEAMQALKAAIENMPRGGGGYQRKQYAGEVKVTGEGVDARLWLDINAVFSKDENGKYVYDKEATNQRKDEILTAIRKVAQVVTHDIKRESKAGKEYTAQVYSFPKNPATIEIVKRYEFKGNDLL